VEGALPPRPTEVVFLLEVVVEVEDLQLLQMVELVELVPEFLDSVFLEEVRDLDLWLVVVVVVALVVLVFLMLPPQDL
jgi:hypothetical protein